MGTKQDSLKQRRAALRKKKREARQKSRQLQGADREDGFLLSPDDELLLGTDSERIDLSQPIRLTSINVSYGPVDTKDEKKISAEVKDSLEKLYYLAQSNPKQAIEPLEKLKQEYPDIPKIYNFLIAAYMGIGNLKKADELIIENYQKHPNYLFARTSYAEYCLRHDKLDEINKIFDNKFDLTLLYPYRRDFHISEIVGFYGILGIFFVRTGKRETAENLYKMLKRLAPDHNTTKVLGEELAKEFMLSRIKNLFNLK